MPKEITAYQCEHCAGKFYRKTLKSVCVHEIRCLSNPVNKTCKTCWHNEENLVPLPEFGHFQADGYKCREGHKPEGVKIVFDCPHWYDWDEGYCDIEEEIARQHSENKLLQFRGAVQ